MKEYIRELFYFYKTPKDSKYLGGTLLKNTKFIGLTIVLELVIFIIIFPFLYYISEQKFLPEDFSKIEYKDNTFIHTIIITAFIIPVIEELIFRLPLRFNTFYYLFIKRSIWNKIFPYIVYLIPFIFGIVHLSNYGNIDLKLILLSPILVGSQIIGGYLYTFLRVKFNFISAIFSHIIWNILATIIPFCISYFEKPYVKTTNNYDVTIEYYDYNNLDNQNFFVDSVGSKIYKIQVSQFSINHIADTISNQKRNKMDFIIDIKLNSKNGISKEDFYDILKEYDNKNNY
ncbi:CPBP family intramembrane glutamic endopeptidase [Empedobacter brevis]|uniref:CPBP family intramembrane glutamic endopeptidase n=1 Tax=Empedobacter brevis TaxID=247 RepID=UPI0023F0EC3D|nr:CPBP family intramembrane glutamic endopeptidase [Empedobacter brevis]